MSKHPKVPRIHGVSRVPRPTGVDRFGERWLSFQAPLQALYNMNRAGRNEADIQAAQSEADQQARVPLADEDGGWPSDAQPSAEAGSGASRRRNRREVAPAESGRVERLPRGRRIRLGAEIRGLLERGKRKRTPYITH